MSISKILTQGLSLFIYNSNRITTPIDNQLNIHMRIDLWSVCTGLPIDIMQMFLSATIMSSQIIEVNHGKSSKVISIESLKQYEVGLEMVNDSSIVKQLKIIDDAHYAYIRTQTAITLYINKYKHVGIKVGLICTESSKQLSSSASPESLKSWDELKFDRWFEAICKDLTMQYLYTRAGLKYSGHGKHVNVSQGYPHTAYPKDQSYIVQSQNKKDIKTICPIQKRVATHWRGIAKVCSSLIQAHLVNCMLLPEDCIKKNNVIATLYNMLNHWANPPAPSVGYKLAFILILDCPYLPMLKDSYRQLKTLDMRCLQYKTKIINEPKARKKCVLH